MLLGKQIIKRYYEEHRFYHNFNHVKQMFDEAEIRGIELSEEQYLSILFHDVVYNPGSKTNEEDSCNVFDKYVFSLKAVSFNSIIVKQIIMDTKTEIPTCESSKIIIDLDLCGLAGTPEQYFQNSKFIAWEYTYNNKLSDKEFNSGRIKWLEEMIEKKQIFYTDYFKPLENCAKFNLAEELDIRRKNESI